MGSVVRLTPFLDVEAASKEARRVDPATFFPDEAPIILAVGMMRPGAKILSYRLLAESLSGLADAEWNLVVIGDGPERANVEAMFGFAEEAPKTSKDTPLRTPLWPAGHLPHKGGDQPSRQLRPTAKTAGYGTPQAAGSISPLVGEMSGRTEGGNVGRGFSSLSLGGRVRFTGALPRAEVLGWMKAADLLAWPGIGEAIGMAYLEAAACRLPVAACDVANVATVVTDGESGLLADGDNVAAYRTVLERLLRDHELRIRLGPDGHRKIVRDHDIGRAAETLKTTMEPLIRRQRPGSAR
jgi:glycosyltransferase involved in cell wall biosynthesis